MHLSSVIIGACLLAIGANADPVKGTIFYGCHEDGADCWYATDRTVSGVRYPPSTDMVSCSNNNMPQGHKRPLILPDPESFRPFFKPLENFPDFSKLGGRRAVKFKA
ncbi:hypothetical protein K4K59_004741 [Colletotrichum sp. SAR11_240]|nr:hypothetical protein K4K59_004741 [Colletotrichum sp. SAR11_240]